MKRSGVVMCTFSQRHTLLDQGSHREGEKAKASRPAARASFLASRITHPTTHRHARRKRVYVSESCRSKSARHKDAKMKILLTFWGGRCGIRGGKE